MQVLYRVDWIHPTDLTVNQGCKQLSTGLPLSSSLVWKGKRSEVLPLWRDGYRVCGGCEDAAGPGRAKTSSPGRKKVPGPLCGGAGGEGKETSGSENETHLVAVGLPGHCPAVCRVRTDSWRETLFEFSHESARLEALHFHGDTKQVEVRLPLTLSKLSGQHFFQMIKRLIRIVADIDFVQNVPKDLLGQAG